MKTFHGTGEKTERPDADAQGVLGARDIARQCFDKGGIHACTRFILERWPYRHAIDLSPSRVRALVEQCGARAFHTRAIGNRKWRRHVCIACGWIADYFPRDISIFEPGCGAGANLLWLASRGFHTISGSDLDKTALDLCRAMQQKMGCYFPVFQDDGLLPQYPTSQQDVILSVNWLYHIPHASLGIFFEKYLPSLKSNGVIICDLVDSAYNREKNNTYHSEDVKKPRHERRPSEYTFRMSQSDVAETAAQYGLHIVRHANVYAVPQRKVYMLSR